MTRLPDLERSLVKAAHRLEAPAPSRAAARRDGWLRGRWRGLGRGGHIAGVLAGGFLLGAVATGSAQVAGLDPWGKLTGRARIDPALRPTALHGTVGAGVAHGPGRPGWDVRAYVARNGKLCVTAHSRGGEGRRYDCSTSARAAASLAGLPRTGPPLAGVMPIGPPSMTQRRVVAWALTDWSAPPVRFIAPARATVHVFPVDRPLRLSVDRATEGLSARGAELVATLPPALTLRLTVAEVSATSALTTRGDTVVVSSVPDRLDEATTVRITSSFAQRKLTGGREEAISDDGALERSQLAPGATPRQRRSFPSLARPRSTTDAIPPAAITQALRRGRIQPSDSRRLTVTGRGNVGPVWIAPGALPERITVPTVDGQVCLAGPAVLSTCQSTPVSGQLPAPEAVVCAPGLARTQSLVWAYVPARADRVRVAYADGTSSTFAAADLLVLMGPRTAQRPTEVVWSGPEGYRQVDQVVFPPNPGSVVCGRGPSRYWELRRSATSSVQAHR